ncbi:MAG: HAD family hydrolase [Aquisalimonadaceae bacterium]
MRHGWNAYASYVFDCDGVLLDSNAVKTDAFRQAALAYGEAEAEALVDYHKAHGGISRQDKFRHFFLDILAQAELPEPAYQRLLAVYAEQVWTGLESCRIAPGALEVLQALPTDSRRYVVSGGAEDEVRRVLEQKGLAKYFHGIYGNPANKHDLVARIQSEHGWAEPALFIGDARYDHVVAAAYGMDFLFVSGLSEFVGWSAYAAEREISVVLWLSECLKHGHIKNRVMKG